MQGGDSAWISSRAPAPTIWYGCYIDAAEEGQGVPCVDHILTEPLWTAMLLAGSHSLHQYMYARWDLLRAGAVPMQAPIW